MFPGTDLKIGYQCRLFRLVVNCSWSTIIFAAHVNFNWSSFVLL